MIEFSVSLLCTLALVPAVRVAMRRLGTMDIPNARSSHSVPTPRGGGWACMAGVVVALLTSSLLRHEIPWLPVCAALALGMVGFLDDRHPLPAIRRLLAQVVIGGLALVGFDGMWWIVAGVLVTPLAVNVVNFMDGINGITGLNVGFWGMTAFVLGITNHVPELVVIGAVTGGSALGFLPWNLPKARIFLGDVGSYFLGALVGFGCLLGTNGGVSVVLLVAPMAIYLCDTGVVLVKRIVLRRPLFEAHRDHVYQRLVGRGLSHAAVSGLTVISGIVITCSWLPHNIYLGVAVTAVVLGGYLLLPRALVPHAPVESESSDRA